MRIRVSKSLLGISIASGIILLIANDFRINVTTFDLVVGPIVWCLIAYVHKIYWPSGDSWRQFVENKRLISSIPIILAVGYPLAYFLAPEIWVDYRGIIATLFSATCALLINVERLDEIANKK